MKQQTIVLAAICLFCLTSSVGYVVGRSVRMRAERVNCCFAIEGYPFWNATRAIVHGLDPYGESSTAQNDVAFYGGSSHALGFEPQAFAYPMFAALPLLPLGWLSFSVASPVLLALFAVLLGLWIGWLRGRWDARTLMATALIFCSYPVLYDFVSLQPTILFLGLAIAALALFRAGQLVGAGAVAAIALGKPQIVVPILLPLLIVTATQWRERRRFAISLTAFLAGLVLVATILQPHWIDEWIRAARDYAAYSPPSLMISWFGRVGIGASIVLFLFALTVLWRHRRSELLFQVAISTVLLYPLMPYRTYNATLLCVALVWLADHEDAIKASGSMHQIVLAIVRVAVVAVWLFTAAGAVLLRVAKWWQIGLVLPVEGLRVLTLALLAMFLLLSFEKASVMGDSSGAVGKPTTYMEAKASVKEFC